MSSRRTARVALITAAGVVSAGAITLLAMPASAATPEVTFTGGCSTLASTSEPDPSSVTTQKSDGGKGYVRVVNELGTKAAAYVDGSKVGTIAKDGAETLWFSTDSSVKLVPDCSLLVVNTDLLSKKHNAAAVNVQEAPEASEPGGGDPVDEQPGSNNPGSNPGSGSGSDSDGVAGNPDSGSRPDAPKDPVARGAKPPADMEGGRVGPDDGSNPDSDAAGAPAGSDGDNNSAAGRDKAGLVSTSHSGPGTTTLALIAVICLLGVAAAALRTIVVSRATRVSSI